MPKVPYQGYSEVAPSTQNINAPVTPEAFGAGTARAAGQLGESIDRAGDKLFQRAMAFQELDNHAENDNLQSGYTKEADIERIRFQSLEGNNAKEDLLNHQAKLDEIRQSWEDKASNPMVRKMFQSGSKPLNVRIQGAAATHTAAEFRKYQNETTNATIERLHDQVAMFPDNDKAFEESMGKLESEVYARGNIKGSSADTVEQDFADQRSLLTAKRVNALAKKDPKAAEAMKDKYIKNGYIKGEDIGKTDEQVTRQLLTTQARIDSVAQVSGSNLRIGEGKVPIAQAMIAIGQIESGNNYKPPPGPEHPVYGHPVGKYQVQSKLLAGFLADNGMPPMTEQEYENSKEAQDELFKRRFGALMDKTGSFNVAAKIWRGSTLAATNEDYVRKANAVLAGNAPLSDHIAHGGEIAKETSTNPLFGAALQGQIISQYNQIKQARRDDEYRTMDTLRGLGAGVGMPNGMRPTALADITAVPEGEIAVAKATPTQMAYLLNNILPHNAKGDYSFTNESFREYETLKGKANSPDPEDRKAFLETPEKDYMTKQWPFQKRDEIINLLRKKKNEVVGNPHVNDFLRVNSGAMQGIVDKKVDADDYFQFIGTAHDLIMAKQQELGTGKLKDEDYAKIGRTMLYQKMEKGWFGRETPGEPAYRMRPSEEEAERIKKLPVWEGRIPSDYWVNRYYAQQVLSKAPEQEKPATKQPTKPPPPDVTAKLVNVVNEFNTNVVAMEAAATARRKAMEEAAALKKVPSVLEQSVPESTAAPGAVPQTSTPKAARMTPEIKLGEPHQPTVPVSEAPPGSVPSRGKGEL